MFVDEAARDGGPKLDEWGHVESRTFADGSVAGVMIKHGEGLGARLVYSKDGNPKAGYDRIWWYEDIPKALEALRSWAYPKPPRKFKRDLNKNPVPWEEE
jgi:hypothetical protein